MTDNGGPGAYGSQAFGSAPAPSSGGVADQFGLGSLATTMVTTVPGISDLGTAQRDRSYDTTATEPQGVSANDFYKQFVTNSQKNQTAYIAQQKAMYNAGFYGAQKPNYGSYGPTDDNAMKAALSSYSPVQSVHPGLSFNQYLDQLTASGAGKNAGPTKQPLTVSYTDPDTLKSAANSAAQQALGRNLTTHELNAFVGAFHGKESAAQKTAYDNGSSYTAPEVTGEATQLVQSHNQVEAQQALSASYLDRLNSMLGVL